MQIIKILTIFFALCNVALAADYSHPISSDHVLGDAASKVVVIVYSSLTCPHCATFYNNVFPLLRQNYIDNKKIAYVSRSMITDQACMAATMISYCKGEQNAHMMTMKFFEHYDTLIKPLLISSGEAAMNQYLSNLQNIAALADISKDQFKVCLENTNLQDSLLKTQKSASEQLEIKTIPFILINGKKYEGAFTYEAISEEINKNL